MALEISDENILSKFDSLTTQGIIRYGPSTAIPLVDEDFPYEFRICPSWSEKPLTVNGKVPSKGETVSFGPGSDINLSHPDQVIGTINSTHILALNIYPVFRPQYLLLTADSYRLQTEPLDLQDLEASWEFLEKRDDFYVMYNCGQDAGCSRNHKHVQIVQKPQFSSPENSFRFFPDADDHDSKIKVPFVCFLQYFDKQKSTDALEVFGIYQELLKKCKKELGIGDEDYETVCAHNAVLTKAWILLIPRRTGTYKGVMANAAGMMGMPTVANRELFAIWKEIGPSHALTQFGIPSNCK